eukprot:5385498-Amphidinium_carterae.1
MSKSQLRQQSLANLRDTKEAFGQHLRVLHWTQRYLLCKPFGLQIQFASGSREAMTQVLLPVAVANCRYVSLPWDTLKFSASPTFIDSTVPTL